MAKINFSFRPGTGDTEKFFKGVKSLNLRPIFVKWGERGVSALAAATPRNTGETANSWRYNIERPGHKWVLTFLNDEVLAGGVLLAVILQYGHLSRSGSFVEGTDYINPAMKPIFDGLQSDIYEELSKL